MKAARCFIAFVALVALLASGCGGSNLPNAVTTSAGEEFPVEVAAANGSVTIERRPRRIVSLSPTATEILFAIGAGPQVVAVDEDSSYPSEAPRTKLSGLNPNTEALAAYRPDLVIYSIEPGNLGASLVALGVPGILQPPAENLAGTYAQILELGVATGEHEEADRVVTAMKTEIDKIVQSRPLFTRPPTYYHELDESYFTATSKTFIGGIYELLGLENIADAADQQGRGYPQLSGEYIIEANPDLVFLANARCCGQSAQTVAARPGWGNIAAVQHGGVIELDDDIASRWGPRIVEFLRSVARSLSSVELER